MQTANANVSERQFEELGATLADMKNYLYNVAQGCQELPAMFHTVDKSQSLETLTQIMEGVDYYQKLLKSAAIILTIDFSEVLYEEMSVSLLFAHLRQVFSDIMEAVENEDYSLLTDVAEYDLAPAIVIAQGMLAMVQERYEERVM
jgi:hypothetical protein